MEDKCNHRIKSKNTTLHLLGRVFICGKEFKFIEDENGELKPFKKNCEEAEK